MAAVKGIQQGLLSGSCGELANLACQLGMGQAPFAFALEQFCSMLLSCALSADVGNTVVCLHLLS